MSGGGGTASEKLGLGTEVRELKFGPSFSGNGKGGSFHTVRYDFKPASVDSTKMATLDVGPNNQVTISIPHSDGVSTNVFKGARKPYTKECVLIVDHVTGEVVLEKLTHTIQVKKTRPERPEGSTRGGGPPKPPVAPAPSEAKKFQPPSLASSQGPSSSSSDRPISKPAKDNSKIKKLMSIGNNSHSPSNSNSYGHRGSNSPMMSVPARHSPLGPSPGHISPGNGNSQNNSSASLAFDNLSKKHHKPVAPAPPPPVPSAMPSLPCIEDLLSFNAPPPQPQPPPVPSFTPKNMTPTPLQKQFHHSRAPAPTMIVTPPPAPPPPPPKSPIAHVTTSGGLSDSSSGDSSSSSSSSSDASDDDSSDEEMEVVPDHPVGSKSGYAPAPSMPSVFDSMPVPMARPTIVKPITSHLLSEDLQLSESGSDSD